MFMNFYYSKVKTVFVEQFNALISITNTCAPLYNKKYFKAIIRNIVIVITYNHYDSVYSIVYVPNERSTE
jgi:hypothetical protein